MPQVKAVTCSGRELARFDVDLTWRLTEVLDRIPVQHNISRRATTKTWPAGKQRRVIVNGVELRGTKDLAACNVRDGDHLTVVVAPPFDVITCVRHMVEIKNMATGNTTRTFNGHTDEVCCAIFSPNAETVVTCSHDQTAKLWSVRTGECLRTFRGHRGCVRAVDISQNMQILLTAGSDDECAKLWHVDTGVCYCTLAGHTNAVINAKFSPNACHVVTVSRDGTAKLWSTEAAGFEKLVFTRGGRYDGAATSADFSPDGEEIIITTAEDAPRVYSTANGEFLRAFHVAAFRAMVLCASFSPDGSYVLTTSDGGKVSIWMARPKPTDYQTHVGTFHVSHMPLNHAHWSPDGMNILTVSQEKLLSGPWIKVWSVVTGECLREFDGQAASFCPKHRRV